MNESTLPQLLQQERERLRALRTEAEARKTAIDTEIAVIDQELAAIAAYHQVKHGKNGQRRSGVRSDILSCIEQQSTGITRSDLLLALNAKGDKASERSITNALAALKRAGKIANNDGMYTTNSVEPTE